MPRFVTSPAPLVEEVARRPVTRPPAAQGLGQGLTAFLGPPEAAPYAARMPSRLHAVYARVVPKVRKAEEMGGPEPDERDRVVRWHADARPHASRPGRCRGSTGASRWCARSWGRRGRLPGVRRHARRATATPTRTLFYLHGGGYMAPLDPFQVRYITRLATALGGAGGDARLPAGSRAHLARQPRRRRRAGRALGGRAGRDRPGGRLVRRRLRAGRRHRPARPRARAGDPPGAARAVGRPDDEHARDRRLRRGRPVAVHRQAARLRPVVGRVPRRPGPAGGEPGAGATWPGCRRG